MRIEKEFILDDKPVSQFQAVIAQRIGLNGAIVLQQIHYWTEVNRENNRNFHEGKYWVFNSFEKWQEQFPFWSISTIKRTFRELERMGILLTGRYNQKNFDRTTSYRIDYDRLREVIGTEAAEGKEEA